MSLDASNLQKRAVTGDWEVSIRLSNMYREEGIHSLEKAKKYRTMARDIVGALGNLTDEQIEDLSDEQRELLGSLIMLDEVARTKEDIQGEIDKIDEEIDTAKQPPKPEPRKVKRTEVFVSYAREDRGYVTRLLQHLRQQDKYEIWSDLEKIEDDAEWEKEIEAALSRAKVFVLMVSVAFLDSPFINAIELPAIQTARDEGGAKIKWLLVSDCNFAHIGLDKRKAFHIDPPLEDFVGYGEDPAKCKKLDKIYTRLVKSVETIFESEPNED